MNLIIDIGNTATKLAVFQSETILFDEVIRDKNILDTIKNIFDVYPKIRSAMVSSVGDFDSKLLAVLSIFCEIHVLDHESKIPFTNSYATPKTLGVDRIALAAAGYYQNRNGNTLVIDAGTCITYDIVNSSGVYEGGAISPGIHLRYKSMNDYTAKLPLLSKSEAPELIGNSTITCMHSGVINGVCAEIDGLIDQYKLRFTDLTVILTGGDAQFLSKRLKNTIFANSKFLLRGLNYILEYNKH